VAEKIFVSDCLSKRERVERTLRLQPVDRVALHDQVSFNPGVIALYTGRGVEDFDYTVEDIRYPPHPRHVLSASTSLWP